MRLAGLVHGLTQRGDQDAERLAVDILTAVNGYAAARDRTR
jgi:hypothetical protein